MKLLCLSLFGAVLHAQTIPVVSLSQPQALNGQWKLQQGDDTRWAQPDFDDSNWSSIAMPDTVNQQFGQRWYRVRVSLSDSPSNEPLGLLVGPFGTGFAYEVFANGLPVGKLGEFSNLGVRLPTVGVFPLTGQPRELLLAFRVRSIPSVYTIPVEAARSVTSIGTLASLKIAEQLWRAERLERSLPGLLTASAIAMAAIFFLTLPLSRSESSEYFWFGFFLLGSLLFRVLPLNPEVMGVERLWTFNVLMVVALSGPIYGMLFLLKALFISRITVTAWIGAVAMMIPATLGPIGQILGSPLPLPTQRTLIFLATCIWFTFYYEVGWRQSTVRGQMRGLHAVLLFHMTATLVQFFAIRYGGLTESQNFLLQTIRLLTLLLVTFAMAVLMNMRSARLASDRQRLGREMAAAAEVQSLMLPGSAQGGTETVIDAVYQPASEVGGDFYQVLDRADGSRVALVGDVSGKGLKAAMLVSVAIGALRREKSSSPAEILAGLNEALLGQGGFVTCCCIRYLPGGELTIASAGHPAPYCDGVEVDVVAGLPLGVVEGVDWTETRLSLQPGEQVTLVSDGVVEAENAQRELFGFDRTRNISGKSAQEIADAAKAWGQNDDITVVTVRRNT